MGTPLYLARYGTWVGETAAWWEGMNQGARRHAIHGP